MNIHLLIILAPLIAAIVAGLFGQRIGRAGAHWLCIGGVGLSFALSAVVFYGIVFGGQAPVNETVYIWMISDGLRMEVGFLIDRLSALMMCVVTFVSLMVHIYTVGYMREDPGYQRFFSYISLFTFAMLMLVMSNNFLQLFFGWEAVGLVSYLLIGFWYKKPTAIHANLKAFLVNRVGDFGFLLGIAAVAYLAGSLDYSEVFAQAAAISERELSLFSGTSWNAMTVICILLFIGAMGKSAQVPLHVWLPDSMEGPTPISALIHAATMVTAGIFMVARMSPLFELSPTALSFVLLIGATTAFFMGLLGIIQNDIKRVVAYSTLSQLGYMTVALGASAYAAGIFHLMTHAFFKALLFLAAGSVIIAMHHEQDIRKMGGLKKYMPITYWTSLIGSLALIGFPGFAGFYSKDIIIEAVHASHIWGANVAYWAVLSGVFITAFYSFRMFFLVFHGSERMDEHTREHLQESPWVVTLPLVLLAIPSVVIGAMTVKSVIFGDYFDGAIRVHPSRDVLGQIGSHFHSVLEFTASAVKHPPLYLALAGVAAAWFVYLKKPSLADSAAKNFAWLYRLFDRKYYFDHFNERVLASGSRKLGSGLWRIGDQALIDDGLVNGSAHVIGRLAGWVRKVQSGYLYHYAFAMVIGLSALLGWLIFNS
ncbi:MAG: NADH-quinone oxidoreductase subunit L [Gammaproteobacteria bacterium]|nr:NADH-quinone oxidoreductase subunit L [Gammaproteobacteria bacterium]